MHRVVGPAAREREGISMTRADRKRETSSSVAPLKRKSRGPLVGLALHAAALAGVAAYSAASWQADANIGLGLGILGFLVLGAPWSLSYFLIDLTSDTGDYAALSYTALTLSAFFNLIIHAREVRRAWTSH
jgi:hypothetical protein